MRNPERSDAGIDPDCRHCAHYHVTWDERAPHGCRAFQFKSRDRPSLVVRESSGAVCRSYRRKFPSERER